MSEQTPKPIKAIRRKDIEAEQDQVKRHELGLLNALAFRYPEKIRELARRIEAQQIAEDVVK